MAQTQPLTATYWQASGWQKLPARHIDLMDETNGHLMFQ
ncbi:hypothetical protein DENIT_13023 [Pseudomonas veronii]|jgi:hypothetical protein|nr:hypothetical protein DENIT_13023 [Pseudomonas veronii]SEB63286.1 hypothetical protein SAMN04490199_2046 [Pseudomonas marginalis]